MVGILTPSPRQGYVLPPSGVNRYPASSRLTSARVISQMAPLPSVVRSTVSSWITTTAPSAVVWTSSSRTPAPTRRPSRKPSRVFSGVILAPPLWAKLTAQPCGVFAPGWCLPRQRPTATIASAPTSAPTRNEPTSRRISQGLSATTDEGPSCLMMKLLIPVPFDTPFPGHYRAASLLAYSLPYNDKSRMNRRSTLTFCTLGGSSLLPVRKEKPVSAMDRSRKALLVRAPLSLSPRQQPNA